MKEFTEHLKIDTEDHRLHLIVASSAVNHRDVPTTDHQVCDTLRNSIKSVFERDEEPYKSIIQRSKSDWRDACHKRSIRDVETLLDTRIELKYCFNPLQDDTDSYEEVSPSISLRATCSPNKLESMIADASQEAKQQEDKMKIREKTNPSSAYDSLLVELRNHWNNGRENYTSKLKSVVSKVVEDQSHLTNEKWSSEGNLLPCVYPMKLNNKGGETYNKSTREHFGSMDVPPTVQFWQSKQGSTGSKNETFLPNGDDLESRMKLAKIDSTVSQSKRSEWNV
ncbi:hypothetical protein V866_001308 [Kwoniella sp. B9012]